MMEEDFEIEEQMCSLSCNHIIRFHISILFLQVLLVIESDLFDPSDVLLPLLLQHSKRASDGGNMLTTPKLPVAPERRDLSLAVVI